MKLAPIQVQTENMLVCWRQEREEQNIFIKHLCVLAAKKYAIETFEIVEILKEVQVAVKV